MITGRKITVVIEYPSNDAVPRFHAEMEALGGKVVAVQFEDALSDDSDPENTKLRASLNALLAYTHRGSAQEIIIARALNLTPAQLNQPPATHELE